MSKSSSCQNRHHVKIISTDSFISLNGRCATSILLAKIHINTHSELLHKLATHASQIPSFFQLLYFLDVGISSVNIRFNFHTGILVGLFSIAHTGHLLDITIPASRAPLIHTSLSYLTFFGGLNRIQLHCTLQILHIIT